LVLTDAATNLTGRGYRVQTHTFCPLLSTPVDVPEKLEWNS